MSEEKIEEKQRRESPTLDPIIKGYLATSLLSKLPPLESTPIGTMREFFDSAVKKFTYPVSSSDIVVTNTTISIPNWKIPVRCYHPKQSFSLPTLVFFHGGGFVFGNLDTLDGHCREIALETGSLVISVDYPLAPENRFPTPSDVCFAVTCAIAKQVSEMGGDPNRLFVGGSSSGATLAAVVALLCRDRQGPPLSGQILLFPMTDTNFSTPSHKEYGTGYNLTTDHCKWFCAQYARSPQDYTHPYFAPLRADTLSHLPRALVVTAELDPLCDEGREYARRLKQAGVNVADLCYKGMIHGFSTLPLPNLSAREDVLSQMHSFIESS